MQKWPDGHGVPLVVSIQVQQSVVPPMLLHCPTPLTQAPSLPASSAVAGRAAGTAPRVPSASTTLPAWTSAAVDACAAVAGTSAAVPARVRPARTLMILDKVLFL